MQYLKVDINTKQSFLYKKKPLKIGISGLEKIRYKYSVLEFLPPKSCTFCNNLKLSLIFTSVTSKSLSEYAYLGDKNEIK